MTDTSGSSMKPQDTTIFLLGGLNAKMDAVISAQSGYDSRLRMVEGLVQALEAHQPKPPTPWYSVVGGISGIAATIIAVIALLNVLNP